MTYSADDQFFPRPAQPFYDNVMLV